MADKDSKKEGVNLMVTAPLPEGWTPDQVAQHFKMVLGIWAGGLTHGCPKNAFTAESIGVKVA